MARKAIATEASTKVPAVYNPEDPETKEEMEKLAVEAMRENVRARRIQNDAAEDERKYGEAVPGTAKGEQEWAKVQEADRKARVIQDVINQITQLENPKFYNAPEGGTVMPIRPGMERFSPETGIFRTAPEQPGTIPGGMGVQGKGHLGAFSNIGSVAGPSLADTDEGRTKLDTAKETLGLLGYRGKEGQPRAAAATKELPEQQFIREQANKIQDQIKGLDPGSFADEAAYKKRVGELQGQLDEFGKKYSELEATRKKKIAESTVTEKPWTFGTAEERAAARAKTEKAPDKAEDRGSAADYLEGGIKYTDGMKAQLPDGKVATYKEGKGWIVGEATKAAPEGRRKLTTTMSPQQMPWARNAEAATGEPQKRPSVRPIPEPVEVPPPVVERTPEPGETLFGTSTPVQDIIQKTPIQSIIDTMKGKTLFEGAQRPSLLNFQQDSPRAANAQDVFKRLVTAYNDAFKSGDMVMADRIKKKIKQDFPPQLYKSAGF